MLKKERVRTHTAGTGVFGFSYGTLAGGRTPGTRPGARRRWCRPNPREPGPRAGVRPSPDATLVCELRAACGSCVTITMVLPCALFRRDSIVSTSCAEAASRLPVGSSARISAGIRDDRTGNGHPLLLAAGKLARIVLQAILQPHQLQRRARRAPCARSWTGS